MDQREDQVSGDTLQSISSETEEYSLQKIEQNGGVGLPTLLKGVLNVIMVAYMRVGVPTLPICVIGVVMVSSLRGRSIYGLFSSCAL